MTRAREIESALRRMLGEWHTRTANASDDAGLPVGELAMALRKLAEHVEDARPSDETVALAEQILDFVRIGAVNDASSAARIAVTFARRDLYRLRDDHAQEPFLVALANQGATKDEAIDRLTAALRATRALCERNSDDAQASRIRLPVLRSEEE
jgi:hypothetical protein